MDERICSICYSSIEGKDKIELNNCSHDFHSACIIEWLRSPLSEGKCPNCRGVPMSFFTWRDKAEIVSKVRKKANCKNASKELKKQVEKLREAEKELVEFNKIYKKYKWENNHIIKTVSKMRNTGHRNRSKIRRLKSGLLLFNNEVSVFQINFDE